MQEGCVACCRSPPAAVERKGRNCSETRHLKPPGNWCVSRASQNGRIGLQNVIMCMYLLKYY